MDGIGKGIPLPEAFVARMAGQLGPELPAFLSALEEAPVRGLRMNALRQGWETPFRDAERPVAWAAGGWEIPWDSEAGITLAHEAGLFYLQDPAAMIPAAVMDARPGEKILDLCAAPGGKSTQMGAAMAGKGLLICNEPVPGRAAVLSRNMERMGVPNAIVTGAWPEKLAEKWPEGFDGVMVDAPCSGEGMFRRHPETRQEWTAEKAAGCVGRQEKILAAAARMVRPGGRLVYATCTWNPAENEGQVERFLRANQEFEMEPFSLPGAEGPEGLWTCWPHRNRGGGQFVARMRKKGTGSAHLPDGSDGFPLSREAEKIWRESGIRTRMPNGALGQTLVWAPEIPDLKGISLMRLGLHLGQIKGKHLMPDHAAALAMESPGMPETALTDGEALRYMAGESLPGDGKGWQLMTWQGHALGWGKGSDGMIRNHYPKGLRNGKLKL